jgi:hypothetical protein|tara:strand:- start:191 stop:388 length:198 start_codon:yes stop_codon:yes gene_type:complete
MWKVEVTTLAPVNSGEDNDTIVVDVDEAGWDEDLDNMTVSIVEEVMRHGVCITMGKTIAHHLKGE